MSRPTTSTARELSTDPLSSPALGEDDARADVPSKCDLLDVVAEFGLASLGLVAWELWSADDALAPAWACAIMEGLLEPAGVDDRGEAMYRLSGEGHLRLAHGDSRIARRSAGG